MNWSKIVPVIGTELQCFVGRELSAQNLYKVAVQKGVGPEVRPLVRSGATRARKITREALRRRNLLSVVN